MTAEHQAEEGKASIDNISFSGTQLVLVYVAITLFFCLSYYLEDMYRSAYGYKIM